MKHILEKKNSPELGPLMGEGEEEGN